MDWLRGKEGNIRALLSTLGDVLWDGESRWPKPGMHLMIEPNQVKKMYRNASRVVHPDKVGFTTGCFVYFSCIFYVISLIPPADKNLFPFHINFRALIYQLILSLIINYVKF